MLSGSFKSKQHLICFTQAGDSLKIDQRSGGLPEKTNGLLYAFNDNNDTLQQQSLLLPATIHINPFVKYYEMETDSADEEFELQQEKGMLRCVALRSADSVSIQVINPQQLSFWYTLFAGNRVIDRGYGNSLLFAEKVRTEKNYFVSLQYMYGNTLHTEDYTVPYKDKLLNIDVKQPAFIYPGQPVKIDIAVTTPSGKPVSHADLTAWSFTNKFEQGRPPFVPYLGKLYPGRKKFHTFFTENQAAILGNGKLNWERWSRSMGLDSIEYFKFLHPATLYCNTEPATDSITQLAPFVVLDGDLQPVHQIYIDEIPYFFSQARQLQRYSFTLTPGRHSLRLRTHNLLITLDSVWAFRGVKTFVSINADTGINKTIRARQMPDTLNDYEKRLWSKYMILVENNFGEAPATIAQPSLLYLLNLPADRNAYTANILTGPLYNQYSNLTVKNQFVQPFETEGNYLYQISKGLIKQKQLPYNQFAFTPFLEGTRPVYNFHDFVLTGREVDSLWQDYLDHRSATEDLFSNKDLNKSGNGQLQVDIEKEPDGKPLFIKNIFLFRYDDADFVRVYKGSTLKFGYVQPGRYRLFLLLKGDDYYIKDSIEIRKDGINYFALNNIIAFKRDSVSTRIASIVNSREKKWRTAFQDSDLDKIKESFNGKYLNNGNFTRYLSGTVRDCRNGSPMYGASIFIKGTRFGTASNQHGYFTLRVPEHGTIVVAMVGYGTEERKISDDVYDIKLRPQTNSLNEVIVVGYGTRLKRDLTSSVSVVEGSNLLMGKAAGVQITVRGAASLSGTDTPPLIIVDGLPFSGSLQDLDASLIATINVLKPVAATALYGSAASAGVILITTKKAVPPNTVTEVTGSNTLRRHFSDVAYWQPNLRTDNNGKASFVAHFPDDITSWRTFVIAIGDKKQTGFTEGLVKSFKSLSAGLYLPAFAIEADTVNMAGKVMNYTLDSATVKRIFSINDVPAKTISSIFSNSITDTLSVAVSPADSLKIKYSIEQAGGFADGEERSIPVYKQGVEETSGYFAALETDTSFSLSFNASAGRIKLYASSSVLPVLLDEIEGIGRYEYLCNEQLASKLQALLLKKKIYHYLKKDFLEEKNIQLLIAKLNQSKSPAGLWGWWVGNDPSLWISWHVTEALLTAEKEGYPISMNKDLVRDYLVYHFEKYSTADQIRCIGLFKALNARVDFKIYTDSVERKIPQMSLYEHLQLLQLKQSLGQPAPFDSLQQKFQTTMFGNIYWGEENKRFFDNTIQNTLLMYRLMRQAGGYNQQLRKVRNYFLEKRKNGQWRNTYESALILETILPDLLKTDTALVPVTLTVNDNQPVQAFPYQAILPAAEKINIRKQGGLPVYFTAYQQYWNKAPQKVSADFTLNSAFEKNGQPVNALTAGEPVIMKVNVTVRGDADYVMIEIPIPAGCSYKDKEQSYLNNEVHREYFKEKVSLFCTSLRKGQYSFMVSLLPRYTGNYHLNPARAEMMYFPVFYGREEMKKIEIR